MKKPKPLLTEEVYNHYHVMDTPIMHIEINEELAAKLGQVFNSSISRLPEQSTLDEWFRFRNTTQHPWVYYRVSHRGLVNKVLKQGGDDVENTLMKVMDKMIDFVSFDHEHVLIKWAPADIKKPPYYITYDLSDAHGLCFYHSNNEGVRLDDTVDTPKDTPSHSADETTAEEESDPLMQLRETGYARWLAETTLLTDRRVEDNHLDLDKWIECDMPDSLFHGLYRITRKDVVNSILDNDHTSIEEKAAAVVEYCDKLVYLNQIKGQEDRTIFTLGWQPFDHRSNELYYVTYQLESEHTAVRGKLIKYYSTSKGGLLFGGETIDLNNSLLHPSLLSDGQVPSNTDAVTILIKQIHDNHVQPATEYRPTEKDFMRPSHPVQPEPTITQHHLEPNLISDELANWLAIIIPTSATSLPTSSDGRDIWIKPIHPSYRGYRRVPDVDLVNRFLVGDGDIQDRFHNITDITDRLRAVTFIGDPIDSQQIIVLRWEKGRTAMSLRMKEFYYMTYIVNSQEGLTNLPGVRSFLSDAEGNPVVVQQTNILAYKFDPIASHGSRDDVGLAMFQGYRDTADRISSVVSAKAAILDDTYIPDGKVKLTLNKKLFPGAKPPAIIVFAHDYPGDYRYQFLPTNTTVPANFANSKFIGALDIPQPLAMNHPIEVVSVLMEWVNTASNIGVAFIMTVEYHEADTGFRYLLKHRLDFNNDQWSEITAV